MRPLPMPRPVDSPAHLRKRRPAAVTSAPLKFSGPSGLSHLASTTPVQSVDYLSGLSGLLQLEADVSRRGLPASGLPVWALLEEGDLPEARIIDCLPSRARLATPLQHRFGIADNLGGELHLLIHRLRRDRISLAAVATRLRGWAACQGDAEQIALSHTGCRYVVAIGLETYAPARHREVHRAMDIARIRFNGCSITALTLCPNQRRSPHLIAKDCYRIWPA
jgi:hypothetical protein